MSGGSLDYAYCKINDVADCLVGRGAIYRPLLNHLLALSKVLKDIEWHLSCDTSLSDEEILQLIKSVVTKEDIKSAAEDALKEMKETVKMFELMSATKKNRGTMGL